MRICGNGHLLVILSVIVSADVCQAADFKTLYQFTGGSDGGNPLGDLIVMNGQLYGTTSEGGLDYGVVFRIDPASGAETVVHAFGGGAEGALPYAGLLAWGGNLWGTTLEGGAYGEGSAFKVNPDSGRLKILHSFGGNDGNDGEGPQASLSECGGQLYGTTESGGALGQGTAFQIDPSSDEERVLVNFDGDSIGGLPVSPLLAKAGVLYGTTSLYPGTIFAIDTKTQQFHSLVRFSDVQHGISSPYAGLIADGHTFYGTTVGGAHDRGSVFEFKLLHDKIKKLHAFADTRRDGNYPVAGVILVNGMLYGTTSEGGTSGKGIVFSINIATKEETILHEFSGADDGGEPMAGLVYYSGQLFGTTYEGALGSGTVFRVTP